MNSTTRTCMYLLSRYVLEYLRTDHLPCCPADVAAGSGGPYSYIRTAVAGWLAGAAGQWQPSQRPPLVRATLLTYQ